jgi:hypothetical protein
MFPTREIVEGRIESWNIAMVVLSLAIFDGMFDDRSGLWSEMCDLARGGWLG